MHRVSEITTGVRIAAVIKITAVMMLLSYAVALSVEDNATINVTRLSAHLYMLSTDQGSYTTNSIASVGDDGVLLIDTQTSAEAEELKRVIDSFGKGSPKYIINTHRHIEHIGGNAIFGDDPVVIAHALVPSKLKSGSFIFEEFPDATYPDITIADSLSLFFNGEKIRIIAFGGSHDDNELIIHFTGSGIVHLSSLVNGFNFPSIDADGDVFMFPVLVARAIELLPQDVIIVSGHNGTGTWMDLQKYYEMLVGTIETVKKGLGEGKSVTDLQGEKVLDKWKSYAGSYVSVDDWIEYISDGFEKKDAPDRKNIYEPIYYAIKDGGLEAGIKEYFDLKNNHPDEYIFTGAELLIIGDKYLKKDRISEAIRFLELSIREYPSDRYTYYTHYSLATAYRKQGKKDLAIQNCEKAIELNPDFQGAVRLLEELKES